MHENFFEYSSIRPLQWPYATEFFCLSNDNSARTLCCMAINVLRISPCPLHRSQFAMLCPLILILTSVDANPFTNDAITKHKSISSRQLIPLIDWNPQYEDDHDCYDEAECKSGYCRSKECTADFICQVDKDCNYSDQICNTKSDVTYLEVSRRCMYR